jgi:hypothetical protein
MSWGSIVVACIAGVGGLIAWRYLPARADEDVDDPITVGALSG